MKSKGRIFTQRYLVTEDASSEIGSFIQDRTVKNVSVFLVGSFVRLGEKVVYIRVLWNGRVLSISRVTL